MLRGLGVTTLVALVAAAVALAAPPPDVSAFKRPHKAYDTLPAAAKTLAPQVTDARRLATAVDSLKRQYLVYVALLKNKQACVVLIQLKSYVSSCKPEPILFEPGRRTFSVLKGLIGGVAASDVKKVVLVGGSKHLTVPLTSDNGFIYGCPAPTSCAKWVKTVVGYNAAGKIVSHETVG